jgi:uncharacterized protein (TIGR03086 family)
VTVQPSTAPTPWAGVELLERAIGYTRGSLALVTPDLMTAPTPCEGWDLRMLLSHLDDSLTSLHEAGSVRRVELAVTSEPSAPTGDLVAALRQRASQVLADWSADRAMSRAGHVVSRDVVVAGRPLTTPVLTSAGALEVTVHGWDVATACRVHRPIPDALAEDLLRIAPVLVTEADRPARFARAVAAPPGASPGERLLAFLGRSA